MRVFIGPDGRYHVTGVVFAGLQMTHGRLRAAIRCADVNGGASYTFHRLIMLWDESRQWPAGGEMDLMEADTDNYHWPSAYNPNAWGFGTGYNPEPDFTQWGIWTAVWTPTEITEFWNGTEINTLIIPNGADCPGPMTPIFQGGSPGNITNAVGGLWQVAWMAVDNVLTLTGGSAVTTSPLTITTPPRTTNMTPQVGQDLGIVAPVVTGGIPPITVTYDLFHETSNAGPVTEPYIVAATDVNHELSVLALVKDSTGATAQEFSGTWTAAVPAPVVPAPAPTPATDPLAAPVHAVEQDAAAVAADQAKLAVDETQEARDIAALPPE